MRIEPCHGSMAAQDGIDPVRSLANRVLSGDRIEEPGDVIAVRTVTGRRNMSRDDPRGAVVSAPFFRISRVDPLREPGYDFYCRGLVADTGLSFLAVVRLFT